MLSVFKKTSSVFFSGFPSVLTLAGVTALLPVAGAVDPTALAPVGVAALGFLSSLPPAQVAILGLALMSLCVDFTLAVPVSAPAHVLNGALERAGVLPDYHLRALGRYADYLSFAPALTTDVFNDGYGDAFHVLTNMKTPDLSRAQLVVFGDVHNFGSLKAQIQLSIASAIVRMGRGSALSYLNEAILDPKMKSSFQKYFKIESIIGLGGPETITLLRDISRLEEKLGLSPVLTQALKDEAARVYDRQYTLRNEGFKENLSGPGPKVFKVGVYHLLGGPDSMMAWFMKQPNTVVYLSKGVARPDMTMSDFIRQEYLTHRAAYFLKSGKLSEAKPFFEELTLSFSRYDFHQGVGSLLAHQGDLLGGCRELIRAVEMQPGNFEFRERYIEMASNLLQQTLVSRGSSVDHLRAVLELVPDASEIRSVISLGKQLGPSFQFKSLSQLEKILKTWEKRLADFRGKIREARLIEAKNLAKAALAARCLGSD